jgi:hypothetical protein
MASMIIIQDSQSLNEKLNKLVSSHKEISLAFLMLSFVNFAVHETRIEFLSDRSRKLSCQSLSPKILCL